VDPSQPPPPDNRPLEEKLVDSDWKTRKNAYGDLTAIFKDENPTASKSSAFAKHTEAVLAMSKDTNPNAFAAGVDAIELYLERYDKAGEIAGSLPEGLVATGFKAPKPKTVEKCRKLIVGTPLARWKSRESHALPTGLLSLSLSVPSLRGARGSRLAEARVRRREE
jgi:hypothetical protein